MPDRGTEPQIDPLCPATRPAPGIAPIPCALPLGHAGEHRSKGGTSWGRAIEPQFDSPNAAMDAIQAAITDNERAALREAAARQWCMGNPGWGTHRCLLPKDHDGAHRCAYCREKWEQ